MRMMDLNPSLKGNALRGVVVFDCPTHRNHRIRVDFHAGPHGTVDGVFLWNARGPLDRLTLSPSIDVAGCWHGFVTDGHMETVG